MGFISFAIWLISVDQITVEVLTQRQITVEVQTVETKPAAPVPARRKQDYVVMFSAKWCGPCQTAKLNEVVQIKSQGIPVRVIDITEETEWASKASRLPTWWICDGETQTRIGDPIVGRVQASMIVEKLRSRTVTRQKANGDVETKTSVKSVPISHHDRVRLHNQLHGGGQWTWPGNLEGHLRDVHGVETGN